MKRFEIGEAAEEGLSRPEAAVNDCSEVLEIIEVAIIELRGVAQPHEIAQFRELGLDAKDAESADSLANIAQQVQSLRAFCERRAKSGTGFPASLPRGRRR